MSVYADGKTVSWVHQELEKHNISSIPITRQLLVDYVFISDDILFLSIGGPALIELNLITNEQIMIKIPDAWIGRRIDIIQQLSYDQTANAIHMLVQEHIPSENRISHTYYILYIDGYTWEKVSELGEDIYQYRYDTLNKIIYYTKILDRSLFVYDLEQGEIIERINLAEDVTRVAHIFKIYDEPLQILTLIRDTENKRRMYYYLYYYDETRTGIEFPQIGYNRDASLDDYVFVAQNRFLCIKVVRQGISEIVEFDLNNNTLSVAALQGFPLRLSNLKKIANGKYSFLVTTDDDWTLLCFMEYS
jgi:hypothetical protein